MATKKTDSSKSRSAKSDAGKSIRGEVKSTNDNVYVAKSKIHGQGLFAARKMPADTVVGLLEGRIVKREGTYVMWISATKGLRITNDFRFINHSDKPNVALYDEEVVTLRAVKKGEELTHNYDG